MGQDQLPVVTCPNEDLCRDRGVASGGTHSRPAEWKRVAAASDIPPDAMKTFIVDSVSVLIVHSGDAFVALQSLCPHEGVSLEGGVIAGSTLTCLEHMWQFDVQTGNPLGDAEEGLRTYLLKNEGGELYVSL
jgi:toluene monooxygenase system ferredoxin subunit